MSPTRRGAFCEDPAPRSRVVLVSRHQQRDQGVHVEQSDHSGVEIVVQEPIDLGQAGGPAVGAIQAEGAAVAVGLGRPQDGEEQRPEHRVEPVDPADADAGMARFEDSEADPAGAGREALMAAARLWARHGQLLSALSDAAAHDDQAARAWREFTEPAEAAALGRVRADIARGRISGIDPAPTVRALVAMNRACFRSELVGNPDADVEALVNTLQAIWTRTLYGAR